MDFMEMLTSCSVTSLKIRTKENCKTTIVFDEKKNWFQVHNQGSSMGFTSILLFVSIKL